MSPKRRRTDRADWPPYLYTNKTGSLRYQHPTMDKPEKLPRDLTLAKQMVRAANAHFDKLAAEGFMSSLTNKKSRDSMTLSEIMPEYLAWTMGKTDRKKTQAIIRTYCKQITESDFGGITPDQITVLHLAEFLDSKTDVMYIKLRSRLIDVFNYCLAKGYRSTALANPAATTLRKSDPDTIRGRLNIEAFDQILEVAKKEFPPLHFAMLIMLTTTLRPVDVVNLENKKFTPSTTNSPAMLKTMIRKSVRKGKPERTKWLEIELSASEEAMIRRAIQTGGVLSPLIVRHMKRFGGSVSASAAHWSQLSVEAVSWRFTKIRDRLGLYADLPVNARPTLYECRALSGDVYTQKLGRSKEEVQSLYGHTDGSTTEIYLEGHAERVARVKAGMDLSRYA